MDEVVCTLRAVRGTRTPEHVGALVGKTRVWVESLESGHETPTLAEALVLARALGVSVDAIFTLAVPAWVAELGLWPEDEIAQRYGVSLAVVRRERLARGIPAYGKDTEAVARARLGAFFDQLGVDTDNAIARATGVPQSRVSRWRARLGIPPVAGGPKRRRLAVPADAPLGQVSDIEIAQRYGVDARSVAAARRRLGIPEDREAWLRARLGALFERLGVDTDPAIARTAGVSHQRVAQWRQELGIPPAPRGRPDHG